jgi:hypothetical protein
MGRVHGWYVNREAGEESGYELWRSGRCFAGAG